MEPETQNEEVFVPDVDEDGEVASQAPAEAAPDQAAPQPVASPAAIDVDSLPREVVDEVLRRELARAGVGLEQETAEEEDWDAQVREAAVSAASAAAAQAVAPVVKESLRQRLSADGVSPKDVDEFLNNLKPQEALSIAGDPALSEMARALLVGKSVLSSRAVGSSHEGEPSRVRGEVLTGDAAEQFKNIKNSALGEHLTDKQIAEMVKGVL